MKSRKLLRNKLSSIIQIRIKMIQKEPRLSSRKLPMPMRPYLTLRRDKSMTSMEKKE